MKVYNRAGECVDVSYDEIKHRIVRLCRAHELVELDVDNVVIRTIQGIYDGISTTELDDLSARICVSLQSVHHGYDTLAGRILMSNLFKTAKRVVPQATFSAKVEFIETCAPGKYEPGFLAFVRKYAGQLDAMVDYGRDMEYNYFSVRTMERGYLMKHPDPDNVYGKAKKNPPVIETPQDMWMRVAVATTCPRGSEAHTTDPTDVEVDAMLQRIRENYDGMSHGDFTHATPTLFHAGTRFEQLSSCYLIGTQDSLDGIYKTISDCAQISKWAGGIGVHISNVRAKGSPINSTNGSSDGIVPMLKVYNETARYCNQSGRRKGSIAIYLEPWHADVREFIELRRNTGSETERTRDLFLALMVPDHFMRCVENDEDWYLMSPDACPHLNDVWGVEFETLYKKYVAEGRYVKSVKAKALWSHVIQCQMETGTPYVLYKDNINRCCNQQNIGTIRSSNLCAEITEYSDAENYAVCNLASIAVNRFVIDPMTEHHHHHDVSPTKEDGGIADDGFGPPLLSPDDRSSASVSSSSTLKRRVDSNSLHHGYDFEGLHHTARMITRNLNRFIDVNFYPTKETERSNTSARPIGIGIQGVADMFFKLGMAFEDEQALQMEAEIMETIYHGALEESVHLASIHGPYERFEGSPFSRGEFQFDMWRGEKRRVRHSNSKRWDWGKLRADMMRHGTRNSLLTALMPTASTSQILGNSEAFEPVHSNIFKRTTIAGEFMVVNKMLMKDMMKLGLWTPSVVQELVKNDGSVQDIAEVPEDLKRIYKTVWELPLRTIVDHAIARGPFVDQSQSMNLFLAVPNSSKLFSSLQYAWKAGLKTGLYYLRSKPAREAVRVASSHHRGGGRGGSANTSKVTKKTAPRPSSPDDNNNKDIGMACSLQEGGACESCSG